MYVSSGSRRLPFYLLRYCDGSESRHARHQQPWLTRRKEFAIHVISCGRETEGWLGLFRKHPDQRSLGRQQTARVPATLQDGIALSTGNDSAYKQARCRNQWEPRLQVQRNRLVQHLAGFSFLVALSRAVFRFKSLATRRARRRVARVVEQ